MDATPQRSLSLLLMSVLCLAGAARAQSGGGSVRMNGEVSGTVMLSIPRGAEASGAGVRVSTSRNADGSLNVSLSGATREPTEVRIPVQIRSNTGYRLFAAARSGGPNLSSLLVVGARPSGSLVFPGAAEAVSVAAGFDGRRGADNSTADGGFNRRDFSALSELLSGPRVSVGGTPLSPQNAVEVVLSAAFEPQPGGEGWAVELLLSAAPAEPLP